jgi:hypothetical protein
MVVCFFSATKVDAADSVVVVFAHNGGCRISIITRGVVSHTWVLMLAPSLCMSLILSTPSKSKTAQFGTSAIAGKSLHASHCKEKQKCSIWRG